MDNHAYQIFSLTKLKDASALVNLCKHNTRTEFKANVHPELSHFNDDVVALEVDEDGNTIDYSKAVKKRLTEAGYSKEGGKKLRETTTYRNKPVLAYEIVLGTGGNVPLDKIDEWKEKSYQWLNDTFNVSDDGKNNIIHFVCHMDERPDENSTKGIHCHAIVVPIDERGKLCAGSFTNGSRALSKLHTSYAEYMEEFGLERGVRGSTARAEDLNRWYSKFNKAIEVPEREPDEDANAYIERATDELKDRAASNFRQMEERIHKQIRQADEQRVNDRALINEQLVKTQKLIDYEVEEAEKKLKKMKARLESKKVEIEKLKEQEAALRAYGPILDTLNKAQKMDKIEAGIRHLEDTNKLEAINLKNEINGILNKENYSSITQEDIKNILTHERSDEINV